MYRSWGVREKLRLFMESQQWGSRRQATQKMARIAIWKGRAALITLHSQPTEFLLGSGSSSSGSSSMKLCGPELEFFLDLEHKEVKKVRFGVINMNNAIPSISPSQVKEQARNLGSMGATIIHSSTPPISIIHYKTQELQ